MEIKKRSFFDRLTGRVNSYDDEDEAEDSKKIPVKGDKNGKKGNNEWMEEENEEAELAVDVYQTNKEIIIQTMVAGVKPDDLDLIVARDMVTIHGKREETRNVDEDDYFIKELYWGKFSRTILLPQEVEPEEAEASERQGLLTVKIPKIDKEKKATVKIKSI